MSNTDTNVYSSCDCYNCDNINKINLNESGTPSNLGVTNCQIPEGFKCADRALFYKGIEPTKMEGIKNINPQVMLEKYAPDFFNIQCKNDFCCPTSQFIANDSRLRNNATGDSITLNIPPIDSSMRLRDIPVSKRLDGYGQNYRTYSDINAGQILYYVDKSIQEPFFSPNFIAPAETSRVVYKDPMDAIKPEYIRKPVFNTNPVGPPRDVFEDDLSFLQDTNAHREDIISKQMAVRNQQRWEPRWQDLPPEITFAPKSC